MGYIRGADRNAVLLFPECVEDYISDDNPVRFIDAFVESLDLVVKQCADAGITTYIAKPLTSVNKKRGLFTKQGFRYDQEKDCYHCPQGEELTFRYDAIEANRQIRYYQSPAVSRLSHQREVYIEQGRAADHSLRG